ncbi:MAG: PilZ domain-containing protein [Chloroflexota bacterium]
MAFELTWSAEDGSHCQSSVELRRVLRGDLWLWFPDLAGAVGRPTEGQSIRIEIAISTGLYTAEGVVVDDRLQGSVVVQVTAVERVQRRRFLRVPARLPRVPVTRLDPLDGAGLGDGEDVEAQVVDLSAGGVRLESPVLLRPRDVLRVPLDLGEGQTIEPIATVISVFPEEDHSLGGEPLTVYEVRAHFTRISEPDRQRVIQWAFRQQNGSRTLTG